MFQVVGFIWGFICQQFAQTIYILGAGILLACVVSIYFTVATSSFRFNIGRGYSRHVASYIASYVKESSLQYYPLIYHFHLPNKDRCKEDNVATLQSMPGTSETCHCDHICIKRPPDHLVMSQQQQIANIDFKNYLYSDHFFGSLNTSCTVYYVAAGPSTLAFLQKESSVMAGVSRRKQRQGSHWQWHWKEEKKLTLC